MSKKIVDEEKYNELEKLREIKKTLESKSQKQKKKILLVIGAVILVVLLIVFVIPNKARTIKTNVKSSLERTEIRSNLETASFTYNVIAKKCKDDNKCDKESTSIKEFEYVISCEGTITSGIDFSKIEIDVNDKEKKLIITMPEATITDTSMGNDLKFINGDRVLANKMEEARKLCKATTKEKSEADGTLLDTAKKQAQVVLQEYYEQWIKAYDSDYKVEVR